MKNKYDTYFEELVRTNEAEIRYVRTHCIFCNSSGCMIHFTTDDEKCSVHKD